MDKKTEALKLALEALNRNDYLGWQTNIHVREAIREALAEQQEPVAWMWEKSHYPESRTVELGLLFKKTDSYGDDVDWTPLYTSPPPRKPLTVVEIMREWSSANNSVVDFAKAIEAAHGIKEKNNG